MKETPEIIAEHYQKTYEITYELWGQRNRTFLLLLAAIAVATLATTPELGFQQLFASLLGEKVKLPVKFESFHFVVLQAILLFVILYLTVNLYHRASYVLRNYAYLGRLETEIRSRLGLAVGSNAFTREGEFYWTDRDPFLGTVKWIYVLLLTVLMLAFFVLRIVQDAGKNAALLAVDLVFATFTFFYLLAYARFSVINDTAAAILPGLHELRGRFRSGVSMNVCKLAYWTLALFAALWLGGWLVLWFWYHKPALQPYLTALAPPLTAALFLWLVPFMISKNPRLSPWYRVERTQALSTDQTVIGPSAPCREG